MSGHPAAWFLHSYCVQLLFSGGLGQSLSRFGSLQCLFSMFMDYNVGFKSFKGVIVEFNRLQRTCTPFVLRAGGGGCVGGGVGGVLTTVFYCFLQEHNLKHLVQAINISEFILKLMFMYAYEVLSHEVLRKKFCPGRIVCDEKSAQYTERTAWPSKYSKRSNVNY